MCFFWLLLVTHTLLGDYRIANRRAAVPRKDMMAASFPCWVNGVPEGSVETREVRLVFSVGDGVKEASSLVLFQVDREFWNSLKLGNTLLKVDDWLAHATWCASVGGSWVAHAIQGSLPTLPRISISTDSSSCIRGKHAPQSDDVMCLILVRCELSVLAVTFASDMRLLECVYFHPGFRSALSVRDTFHEGDDLDCIVCCAELKNTVLLPCRHLCCCSTCLSRLDKCPICRSPVESYVVFGERGDNPAIV
jgi:hypothetical protein